MAGRLRRSTGMTPASSAPLRRLVLGAVLALVLAGGAGNAAAAVYCVERDADVVAGHAVHDGVRRCVPGP